MGKVSKIPFWIQLVFACISLITIIVTCFTKGFGKCWGSLLGQIIIGGLFVYWLWYLGYKSNEGKGTNWSWAAFLLPFLLTIGLLIVVLVVFAKVKLRPQTKSSDSSSLSPSSSWEGVWVNGDDRLSVSGNQATLIIDDYYPGIIGTIDTTKSKVNIANYTLVLQGNNIQATGDGKDFLLAKQ